VFNIYFDIYGTEYQVESLTWSNNHTLNTCEDHLKNKVQEGLVGVDALEMGEPLVLKHMLDIIMDVNNNALLALT